MWISAKDRLPTKKGDYLCVLQFNCIKNGIYYDVLTFSKNLYVLDSNDFAYLKKQEDKSGFFRYDSEWGYSKQDVIAWMEIPKYERS